ncbi:SRPBCC family protein [Wenyingzhuangia sp. IMCC45533]
MKKFFLYGTLVIILAVVALGFIAPKSATVERSVVIEKPIGDVFRFFSFLQNMNLYSPWQAKDPNAIHKYIGVGNTVGSIHRWESSHKDVGVGEQEIKSISLNKKIVSELRFEEPFESTSEGYFKFDEVESGTKVTWGYYGSFSFIESIVMLFMDMEREIGDDFKQGLDKAKTILEKL